MPRTLTRPIVGTDVWYYTAAPPTGLLPLAGKVIAVVTQPGSGVGSPPATYDVAWYDATAAAGAGAWAKALAVPFHYGTRPVSGAWCTMPRVNMPAVGAWPSAAAL